MGSRIVLVIGIGLIAFFMFLGSTGFVQSSRTVWEYKLLENSWDERQMSSLGAEGWELVAIDATRGDHLRAFFKRPKQ